MQRLSEMKSSNIGRLMNKVDAGRIRRFEAENLPRFDQIHTVSDDETGFLKQAFSLQNVLTIPTESTGCPRPRSVSSQVPGVRS